MPRTGPEEPDIARSLGWTVGAWEFNWTRLIENKNNEIKRLNNIYKVLLEDSGAQILHGRARLSDPHTVLVNGQTVHAEHILVATGARARVAEFSGREHVMTSDDAFHLKTLPRRMLIIGGGYIAAEFAGIFHGLGVDTTLLYRGALFLRGFDVETRQVLAEEMRAKGLKLRFNAAPHNVARGEEGLQLRLCDGETLPADAVLCATGRVPNADDLGLEAAGVARNERGAIIVDRDYRSSSQAIYAIGDVTDRIQLTPVAIAEGTALAHRLFGNGGQEVDYRDIPTCVFSQPAMASAGLSEEAARREYPRVKSYRSRFRPLRLSLSDSAERCFVKLVVDEDTDRVLGAHMVGEEAAEVIQGLAVAIKSGARKSTLDATVGIHPSSAEEFTVLR